MKKFPGGRLDLLYRISQTINSSLDLDVVMESLMDEVIGATHAHQQRSGECAPGHARRQRPDGTFFFRCMAD